MRMQLGEGLFFFCVFLASMGVEKRRVLAEGKGPWRLQRRRGRSFDKTEIGEPVMRQRTRNKTDSAEGEESFPSEHVSGDTAADVKVT